MGDSYKDFYLYDKLRYSAAKLECDPQPTKEVIVPKNESTRIGDAIFDNAYSYTVGASVADSTVYEKGYAQTL